LKRFFDFGPNGRGFQEITAICFFLTDLHSFEEVSFGGQPTDEDFVSEFICRFAFEGSKLGKLYFLVGGEGDLHESRVERDGVGVNRRL
jgi:hypothetical protein